MSVNRQILKDSSVVFMVNTLTQGVSVLVPIMIASRYGASLHSDAYYLASVVPSLLVGAIVGGAIKLVFVPVFIEEKLRNPSEAMGVANSALTLITLISILTTVIYGLLIWLGAIRLSPNPDIAPLASQLALLFLPFIPLSVLFTIFAAIYNSYQLFGLPELLQVLRPVAVLAFVFAFDDRWGIASAVVGQMVGEALAALGLVIGIRSRLDYRIHFRVEASSALSAMLKLSLFPFLSYCLTQSSPLIARLIAASLPAGSVSILGYAERLASIPILLVSNAFSAVLLSHWSRLTAGHNAEALRASLNRMISSLLMVAVPAAAGLAIISRPIVNLVYNRGAFEVSVAETTALVLGVVALQGIPTVLHSAIVRALHAAKAVRIVFGLSAFSLVASFGLMLLFATTFGLGVVGVAIGKAIASGCVMLATATVVHRWFVRLALSGLAFRVAKVALATAAMWLILALVGPAFSWQAGWIESCWAIACLGLLGSAVYIAILRVLKYDDLILALQVARTRAAYLTRSFSTR